MALSNEDACSCVRISEACELEVNKKLIKYINDLASSKEEQQINLRKVEELLQEGADINAKADYGRTLLHEVAKCWHPDVAEFLIDNKANVDKGDHHELTPLHIAAGEDHEDMVKFLLNYKANHCAETPYTPAATAGSNVKNVYEEYIDARDSRKRTPLMVAAQRGCTNTCKLLLSHGAKAYLADESGELCIVTILAKAEGAAKDALDQFYKEDKSKGRRFFYLNRLEPDKAKAGNGKSEKDRVKEDKPEEVKPNEDKPDEGKSDNDKSDDDKSDKDRSDAEKSEKDETDKAYLKEKKYLNPMEVVVVYRQYDIIKHPVFRKLIEEKWDKFGRRETLFDFLRDLLLIILWTAMSLIRPSRRACYYFPVEVYRVILWIVAVLYTLCLFVWNLRADFCSKKRFDEWKEWKEKKLDDMLGSLPACNECSKPREAENACVRGCMKLIRWIRSHLSVAASDSDNTIYHGERPCERAEIEEEKKEIKKLSAGPLCTAWNVYDWLVYSVLVFSVCVHIYDIATIPEEICTADNGEETTAHYIQTISLSCAVIFVWIRIFKSLRACELLGPFIAKCANTKDDVLRLVFLYVLFWIPFTCIFWIFFGGSVEYYATFMETAFTLFRMTLVDDYNYEGLREENAIACDILVGTFLATTAVYCINTFTSTLTDSFITTGEDVESDALMVKASIILGFEHNLSPSKLDAFREHVHQPKIEKIKLRIRDKLSKRKARTTDETVDDLADKVDKQRTDNFQMTEGIELISKVFDGISDKI